MIVPYIKDKHLEAGDIHSRSLKLLFSSQEIFLTGSELWSQP